MRNATDGNSIDAITPRRSLRDAILSPRCLIMMALGFSSGLPFAVTGETAGILLVERSVDVQTIGAVGGIASIYAFKFLWSPVVDVIPVPGLAWLGRRRSWLLATQLPLMVGIALLAAVLPSGPAAPLHMFIMLLLGIAVLSATQDIVVNAWTVDAFPRRDVGIGSAMSVAGYRVALLAGGTLAPFVAVFAGWPAAFLSMAALMATGLVAAIIAAEPAPQAAPDETRSRFVGEGLILPVREIASRLRGWFILVIVLAVAVRLPDQLASSMQKPLLLASIQYEMAQYGVVRNGLGLVATLLGSLFGGIGVARLGLLPTLIIGVVAAALSNLGFAWMAIGVAPLAKEIQPWFSQPMFALVAVGTLENFSAGLAATAFVAWLMSLCARRYAATQYAILSGAMAFSGGIASWASGYLAKAMSWPAFFTLTALAGVPALLLLPIAVPRARRADD